MPDLPSRDLVVELPLSAFSLEAAKRAAYSLMAALDVSFAQNGNILSCTLRPTGENVDLSSAERDFRREVLDHDLRISIEQRTERYRDAVLGLAFSRTGLQGG